MIRAATIAMTMMLALLFVAPPVRAIEQVGTAGEWQVGCEWNEPGNAASCFVASVAARDGHNVTVFYYPFENRVLVVDDQPVQTMTLRIDGAALGTAECPDRRCTLVLARPAALERGTKLTVALSGPVSFDIDKSLYDMRRAMRIAWQWAVLESNARGVKPPAQAAAPAQPPAQGTPPGNPKGVPKSQPQTPPPATGQKPLQAEFGDVALVCDEHNEPELKCVISVAADWEDEGVTVFLAPVVPVLAVGFSGGAFAATARIDGGAANAAKCREQLCFIASPEFLRGLDKGRRLSVAVSARGRSPLTVEIDLAELRQAMVAANKWLAARKR